MELVPAGVPLSFEVTYDRDDLNVGMSVYDDTGASPVLLLSPFAMTRVAAGYNTYRGKFTPEANKSYIVIKAVYTDNTFETLDTDYSQGSESVYAQYFSTGSAQPCSVVGLVDGGCCDGVQTPFSLFRGDDKTMNMKVVTSGCGGDPLDLTSCTEINVALPNADGTISHRKLSDGQVAITAPALLGKFQVTIPSAVSAVLNPGVLQNIDVTFTIAAKIFTVRFNQALSVLEG